MKGGLIWLLTASLSLAREEQTWEDAVVMTAMQLPLRLEQALFDVYGVLKMYPTLHVCVFYLVVFLLLLRLLCRKEQLNIPMAYTVVDERAQSEALSLVTTELQKAKPGGQVENLQKELNVLLESHHEFQKEILDSHRDILKELDRAG